MTVEVVEVREGSEAFRELLSLAERLGQAKYIPAREAHIEESVLLGAFDDGRCGLPPVHGSNHRERCGEAADTRFRVVSTEGYVEAFGVEPGFRRRGIGKSMQKRAISFCEGRGCHQIRSRSPVSSRENYALKISMGYAVHPSAENDSYFFVKTLPGESSVFPPGGVS